MIRSRVLAVVTLMVLASAASAGVHTFPSAGSTVVGSIGFIDADEIGFFWSVGRGDSVAETFADPLASVTGATLDLDVVRNVLSGGNQVDWDVRLNGTLIGNFTVAQGFTGPLSPVFAFAPVAPIGGNYTVRLEVTNEVPGGSGSHTFAYAGQFQHSVTLTGTAVPEPATVAMLGFGALLLRRRRRA